MAYNFYILSNQNRFKILLVACFTISFFSLTTVKAQSNKSDSEYGLSIGTDYDVPVGNLGYTFKPALNYNLNLLRNYENVNASLSFGYHSYKPKQDTFYYQVSDTEYGTVKYQNFSVYSFYLGFAYNLELTQQLKIYGGVNLGAYYTHFAYHSSDFLTEDNADLHEEDLYVAPRLGLAYIITNNIGIGIESKYNFFAPTGDSRYNYRVGALYNSYSAGIRLTYNF